MNEDSFRSEALVTSFLETFAGQLTVEIRLHLLYIGVL